MSPQANIEIPIPTARVISVDTRGAEIITEDSPATKDSRGIYLPHHIEPVSHIAIDIGGSLAKVVYFTRSPASIPSDANRRPSYTSASSYNGDALHPPPSGALTPKNLKSNGTSSTFFNEPDSPTIPNSSSLDGLQTKTRKSRAVSQPRPILPGGLLNFARFETAAMEDCVEFISHLISHSAQSNSVSLDDMKKSVKIMATGGGAHKFEEMLEKELGVEIEKMDEMDCLIIGLGFLRAIKGEVFWYSDELVYSISHLGPTPSVPTIAPGELPRPSPNPPQYSVTFDEDTGPATQFPCLLVNIGSGVSIVRVDEDGSFERVSGTSLGGGTLWGLLSLLTPAESFDEMLALSEEGDNAAVDMLVGDIYGSNESLSKVGLKSSTIASSFGKVFKKGQNPKGKFKPEDISRSLLYAVSNNIGQIAYMNAEKYNLDKIYFGGCFIRGHPATISTLSYAIRFWSKGTKRAMFLRHEGFLGSIGAWIKNLGEGEEA